MSETHEQFMSRMERDFPELTTRWKEEDNKKWYKLSLYMVKTVDVNFAKALDNPGVWEELEWYELFEVRVIAAAKVAGIKPKDALKALYVILTRKDSGIPMYGKNGLLDILGQDEVLARIDYWNSLEWI